MYLGAPSIQQIDPKSGTSTPEWTWFSVVYGSLLRVPLGLSMAAGTAATPWEGANYLSLSLPESEDDQTARGGTTELLRTAHSPNDSGRKTSDYRYWAR